MRPRLATPSPSSSAVDRRARELFDQDMRRSHAHTDRIFAFLMIGQWVASILFAVVMGWWFFGERMDRQKILAACIIVSGVVLLRL